MNAWARTARRGVAGRGCSKSAARRRRRSRAGARCRVRCSGREKESMEPQDMQPVSGGDRWWALSDRCRRRSGGMAAEGNQKRKFKRCYLAGERRAGSGRWRALAVSAADEVFPPVGNGPAQATRRERRAEVVWVSRKKARWVDTRSSTAIRQ